MNLRTTDLMFQDGSQTEVLGKRKKLLSEMHYSLNVIKKI